MYSTCESADWKLHRFFKSPPPFYLLIIIDITVLLIENDKWQNKRQGWPLTKVASDLSCSILLQIHNSWSNHSYPVSVQGVSGHSVQSYAGLVGLVVLAGGEAAHIVISDGRVLGFKLYSNLPGSKSKKKRCRYITVIIKCMTAWKHWRLSKDIFKPSDRLIM